MDRRLLIVLILLTACSFSTKPTESILATTENPQNESAPLRLDILQEANTNGSLTVQGQVVAKTDLPSNAIGVRLRAIDGAGQTRETIWVPTDSGTQAGSQVKKGTKVPFTLALSVQDITDYQVEVLWGDEARSLVKKEVQPVASGPAFVAIRNLRISRVPDPKCAGDPCLVGFHIAGEIFNSGQQTITGLSLATGILSMPEGGDLDLTEGIPQNERRIEVQNLSLSPGATKPLKLAIDEMFDAEVAQYLKPTLRIISVRTGS